MPSKAAAKSQRGRPFEADGAITRNKIIDAARECFARNGYGSATNRMIAETAGVTASAIYNYFPAKKDIYLAVVSEGENYIAEAYEQAIAEIKNPIEAICAILDTNIVIFEQRPDLPPFFGHVRTETMRYPELMDAMKGKQSRIRPILHRLVEQAQQQGLLNKSLKTENIEMMLFAGILGLSLFGLQTDKQSHKNNMTAFRMLLDGSLTSN